MKCTYDCIDVNGTMVSEVTLLDIWGPILIGVYP